MNKDLKLVVDNSFKKKENKLFFEKKELKNILDWIYMLKWFQEDLGKIMVFTFLPKE